MRAHSNAECIECAGATSAGAVFVYTAQTAFDWYITRYYLLLFFAAAVVVVAAHFCFALVAANNRFVAFAFFASIISMLHKIIAIFCTTK